MQLCFATHNEHKILEVQKMLPADITLQSLMALGHHTELEETATTLQGNALQKADFVWQTFGISCFADDTGLEVNALNNEPGVYSARYAGLQRSAADNMQLLLQRLQNKKDRSAQFRTVICLILNGEQHFFEGVVKGTIAKSAAGNGGFGYDPVFIPEGYSRTFAELTTTEKNQISHRGQATQKLVHFLQHRFGA